MSRNGDTIGCDIANGLSDAAQGVVAGANTVGDGVVSGANAVGDGVVSGANAMADGAANLVGDIGNLLGRRLDETANGRGDARREDTVAAEGDNGRRRFPRITAAGARLRALLSRADVRYALQLGKDFPGKSTALLEKYRVAKQEQEPAGHGAGAAKDGRRRVQFGLDSLGDEITELTKEFAETLQAISSFFDSLGDITLLEVRSIELGGSSLCDVLDFGSVEASVSFDLTLFPDVCLAGKCLAPIELNASLRVRLDPGALWQSMQDAVVGWVESYMENLDLQALWDGLTSG